MQMWSRQKNQSKQALNVESTDQHADIKQTEEAEQNGAHR